MVSWKGGVVLLVVFLGLALVAYRQLHQPAVLPTPTAAALVPCSGATATFLHYESAGQVLELSRAGTDSRWMLSRPVAGPADPNKASSLLDAVHTMHRDQALSPPSDLSTYGLVKPARTLACRVAGGGLFNLSIGNQSFDGSGFYTLLAGDSRVYVTSAAPVFQLDQAVTSPPVQPSPVPAGSPSP